MGSIGNEVCNHSFMYIPLSALDAEKSSKNSPMIKIKMYTVNVERFVGLNFCSFQNKKFSHEYLASLSNIYKIYIYSMNIYV